MTLRQTTWFVESLLRLACLHWIVPDFSTLSRRQKTLSVSIRYRGSHGSLNLLIDSTGIKVEGESEWHARKHGGPKRRVWRKTHLGIDEETLEIQTVEITGCRIGDVPILPDFLNRPPQMKRSPASREMAPTTPARATMPSRIAARTLSIPPRKSARPWQAVTAGAAARNDILRVSKYLGRALWRRWSGYHRRSRVETKVHCVKPLGQKLMTRDFDR